MLGECLEGNSGENSGEQKVRLKLKYLKRKEGQKGKNKGEKKRKRKGEKRDKEGKKGKNRLTAGEKLYKKSRRATYTYKH